MIHALVLHHKRYSWSSCDDRDQKVMLKSRSSNIFGFPKGDQRALSLAIWSTTQPSSSSASSSLSSSSSSSKYSLSSSKKGAVYIGGSEVLWAIQSSPVVWEQATHDWEERGKEKGWLGMWKWGSRRFILVEFDWLIIMKCCRLLWAVGGKYVYFAKTHILQMCIEKCFGKIGWYGGCELEKCG